MKRQIWDCFTNPGAVAVVGASEKEGSVGGAVLVNLTDGHYALPVYAVNAKRDTVLGQRAYPDLASLPSPVDLAVIATPASTVPDLLRQCGEAGVPAAIVLSAGFEECGVDGHALGLEMQKAAIHGGIRVLGPNCVGLINPHSGLNATFGTTMPMAGNVAFLSQSGALGTAILDWSVRESIGLSTFVSLGSMLDLGWAEILDYLSDDPRTESIVIYMESIGNAHEFLSAARELTLSKPIIVLKAGRHAEGARAAVSHTGTMAGSDDVLDAAFDRCGILRVTTIAELFYMAEALSKQPRPRGPRVTIVTNAGGPGVLAADSLADERGKLADLAPETISALDRILPASWSRNNPVDVLGDASPERYAHALKIALSDPNTDAVLAILTPQAMTNPTETARAVAAVERPHDKPLLASWLGGASVAEGAHILQASGIPCFPYPDTAARIAQFMYRYGESLKNLYETPDNLSQEESRGAAEARLDDASVARLSERKRSAVPRGPHSGAESGQSDRMRAVEIVHSVQSAHRTLLTESESKQFLECYGIPTVETTVAQDATQAVEQARHIGFPVALKLNSETVTHKSKIGGVRLNLADETSVKRAFVEIRDAVTEHAGGAAFQGVTVQPMVRRSGFELIVGCRVDQQFGPVLLFGTGGVFAETIADFSIGLPPLNSTLAARMMSKTRAMGPLSLMARKMPNLMRDLEALLISFGQLVLEHTAISEIEINPLLVSEQGLLALDARVSLQPAASPLIQPAITPYPSRLMRPWTSESGVEFMVRPIRPEDETAMTRFHNRVSDTSVYQRYFSLVGLQQRVAHDRLAHLCFIDYDRQMALVAEYPDAETGTREIAGVGRLVRLRRSRDAEFALLLADAWQGQGIGSQMLRWLIDCARQMGVESLSADILADNHAMQHICRDLGFEMQRDTEARVVRAVLSLRQAVATV